MGRKSKCSPWNNYTHIFTNCARPHESLFNMEYFAPQNRNLNRWFNLEAKLALVMWHPLANHTVTSCSFGQLWAYFIFAPFLFFMVSLRHFPAKWFKILPNYSETTKLFLSPSQESGRRSKSYVMSVHTKHTAVVIPVTKHKAHLGVLSLQRIITTSAQNILPYSSLISVHNNWSEQSLKSYYHCTQSKLPHTAYQVKEFPQYCGDVRWGRFIRIEQHPW